MRDRKINTENKNNSRYTFSRELSDYEATRTPEAADRLARAMLPYAWGCAAKACPGEPEEALGAVWLGLVEGIRAYDPGRGSITTSVSLHVRQSLRGWRQEQSDMKANPGPPPYHRSHVDSVEAADLWQWLLSELDEDERALVEGTYWRGYAQRVIAAGLGVATSRAYSIKRAVLTKLRRKLRAAGFRRVQ